MVVDWPSITLKEAAKFYSGGTPSKSKSEYWGGDIPWISAKSMYGNRFSDSDLKLTEEGLNAGSRLAPKDSILLLVRGSMLHQKIPLGIATKPVAFNQDVKAIIPSKEFLPEFFYYSLAAREHELLSKVESTGIGAGKLDSDVLNNFEILCPPIIEQVAIVTVFRTIDDKIERNTQLNQTLESMAQAIFKSWFVDFDPVIDNAIAAGNPIPEPFQARAERRRQRLHEVVSEGQSPLQPLPAELRRLFPNAFQETEELGWVPEGWTLQDIGLNFQLLGGHPFESKDYADDGEFGIVTIRNVQDGIFVRECSNRISKIPVKMKEYCKLEISDILLSLTGNVGRVCFVSDENLLLNQRVCKIVGRHAISNSFSYFFFRQKSIFQMMLTIAKGTAQQNLSPIETMKIKQWTPDNSLILELSKYLDLIFEKIVKNTVQSQSLAEIRNLLLPKLLSGQLRIPDAEAQLAEAGV